MTVKTPKALGDYVIIEAKAESAGTEVKSSMGIIIEQKRTMGEIPLVGKIIDVGETVDKELLGKTVLLPHGKMNKVPHPDVINGVKKEEEIDLKWTVTHKQNIVVVYG